MVETVGGASNFSALQADLSDNRTDRFVFYVFDLLYLDGFNLQDLPLVERKTMLEKLTADAPGLIRYSGHFEENGPLILDHACRLSLEGIVSKLRDAPYRSGRVKDWIKAKCSQRQEFVIGGYVPSTTSRRAIGSLVMGVYNGKKLEHVGRVGTGYSASVAEDLFRRLERIRAPESPFAEKLSADAARQVRYVKPQLVAEVEFRAWTADNNLRHAAFRGLREDKHPSEIVRETPKAKASPQQERPTVKLTHPDRIYWPEEGVTKQGLADYYTEVWKYIAPFVVARPLALLRGPEGITGETFFQKACLEGPQFQYRLGHRSKREGRRAVDQYQRSGWADRSGAVGGAGNSSLGLDNRRLGAPGHDHHGSGSGREMFLGNTSCSAHVRPGSG